MAAGVVQNLFIPHLIYENRFLWWKRGGKVIANFCSTNKFCGFTGSRSSSLQRNPTNSIMRWCCSSIEYAVSTFHTEFMSFFLFLNGTKFISCFILAKFSPAQAALYITSSSPFDSLPLHCFFRLDKEMPSNFFFSWPKAIAKSMSEQRIATIYTTSYGRLLGVEGPH